jgi:hypothetical protein
MFNSHVSESIPAAGSRSSGHAGFTAADLVVLDEIHATAVMRRWWRRGQLVENEFAHYLAVWGAETDAGDPPALALARFRKTGTYALTIGSTVVASGKSLSDVLPALSSSFDRSG